MIQGRFLGSAAVASSQVLRGVIYADSDDEDSPLGDGADGIYDRVEHKYNRQGERTELKDQRETVHVYERDKLGREIHDRVTALGSPHGGSSSSSSSSGSSGLVELVDGTVRRISRSYEVRGMLAKVTSHDNPTVGAVQLVASRQGGPGRAALAVGLAGGSAA